jgi:hypothetical protein
LWLAAKQVAEKSKTHHPQDLLTILVERNLISPAQAQLVQTDIEVTGMHTEDILLARRWINAETLMEVAPWLKQELQARPKTESDPQEVEANRKKYREITNQILDENLK